MMVSVAVLSNSKDQD